MTTHRDIPSEDAAAAAYGSGRRSEIGRLFAAALESDRRAEAALHLLGGFDDDAHQASFALLHAERHSAGVTPPGLLASIDRTLAALRDHERRAAAMATSARLGGSSLRGSPPRGN